MTQADLLNIKIFPKSKPYTEMLFGKNMNFCTWTDAAKPLIVSILGYYISRIATIQHKLTGLSNILKMKPLTRY